MIYSRKFCVLENQAIQSAKINRRIFCSLFSIWRKPRLERFEPKISNPKFSEVLMEIKCQLLKFCTESQSDNRCATHDPFPTGLINSQLAPIDRLQIGSRYEIHLKVLIEIKTQYENSIWERAEDYFVGTNSFMNKGDLWIFEHTKKLIRKFWIEAFEPFFIANIRIEKVVIMARFDYERPQRCSWPFLSDYSPKPADSREDEIKSTKARNNAEDRKLFN